MCNRAIVSRIDSKSKAKVVSKFGVRRTEGTLVGNKPSTNRGIFNVELTKVGDRQYTLRISIHVKLSFEPGYPRYNAEKTSTYTPSWVPGVWTAGERKSWAREMKRLVEEAWSEKYTFAHKLKGTANVTINVVYTSSQAHWILHIAKISGDAGSSVRSHPDNVDRATRRCAKFDSQDIISTDLLEDGRFTQVACVHEFGHMLGLGDVYIDEDSGRKSGDQVAHSDLAKVLIGETVVSSDNDDVMSVGSFVSKADYSTFLEALRRTSKDNNWYLGSTVDTYNLAP